MSQLYIGLMSGTSMDAIDAALVELTDKSFRLLATHRASYPAGVRSALQALSVSGNDEINRCGQLDRQVGLLFANVCTELLGKTGYSSKDIRAIGSHGQTIRHAPELQHSFTLQIGDPNVIAEITGITTIADFRRRDMVRGGQGAPLTPAFHQFAFRNETQDSMIVNIGGISNLTFLPADQTRDIMGFDCGPGNTLLDNWILECLGQPYDKDGRWASEGQIIDSLLASLLADPYFAQRPPKSTGFEYFNLNWVKRRLNGTQVKPQDLQATLSELAASTIINGINQVTKEATRIYLCGGGVHNTDLVHRIDRLKGHHQVTTTAKIGLDPEWVEAVAFAWLAMQTLEGLPGSLPSVTGAKKAGILGGVYLG